MDKLKLVSMTIACAITAGSFALTSAAAAKPIDRVTVTGPSSKDMLSERVSYRDLNLAVARDQKKLVRRVSGAVSRVCPRSELTFYVDLSSCRSYAWSGAKPQIALAIERANQIASTGFSSIAPVAIVIAVRPQ